MKNLIKVNDNFYDTLADYLQELSGQKEQMTKDSVFSEEAKLQIDTELLNSRKIINDIYDRRERKLVQRALTNARTNSKEELENLLPFEKVLYTELLELLKKYREIVLNNILTTGRNKEKKQKALKTACIKVTEEVPSFVWEDEKAYGPFKKDSETELPKDIAEFLIENNKAVWK